MISPWPDSFPRRCHHEREAEQALIDQEFDLSYILGAKHLKEYLIFTIDNEFQIHV